MALRLVVLVVLIFSTHNNLVNAQSNSNFTVVGVNDWGSGFNATFECEVISDAPVKEFIFEFNYTGSGNIQNAWTQLFNGKIEKGLVGRSGGYAVRGVISDGAQALLLGDTFRVAVQVTGAGYNAADFNVTCDVPTDLSENEDPLSGNEDSIPTWALILPDGSMSTVGSVDANNDEIWDEYEILIPVLGYTEESELKAVRQHVKARQEMYLWGAGESIYTWDDVDIQLHRARFCLAEVFGEDFVEVAAEIRFLTISTPERSEAVTTYEREADAITLLPELENNCD